MRNKPLDALFPKTRQGILAATLLNPDRWWFMADLARHLGVPPSSLQRELPALVASGILQTRREGKQLYYQPNPQSPILPELRGLLLKTAGLVDVLREALAPHKDRIATAFVYGSFAKGTEVGASDVDVVVIGDIPLAVLSPALERAEKQLEREVNPTVYTAGEFAKKLKAEHHFLREIVKGPKLLILGTVDELERSSHQSAPRTPRDELGRAQSSSRSGRARSQRR